ncbi:FixH family protein [Marinibactrum halimedae]|uniref:YtkA-like domain-containing protein n=1 Tax=Marinibactrum halimedae TaxID=1444977 RepID=A0AA37WKH6_9GAMM|nr:FixH family protein [Marinibactrum halimedae]MCD9458060.1 FixH family protein [Marinibactrum halimedae]GLS24993.1 hypothetical protein GCM10007877_07070 [Marinibactrum halimedae]
MNFSQVIAFLSVYLLIFTPFFATANTTHSETIIAPSNFVLASKVYHQARTLEQQSIKGIRHANNLRKAVNKLNALKRKEPNTFKHISKQIDLLELMNNQESAWQEEGNRLRESGKELNMFAQKLMQNSFKQEWPQWIKLSGPMRLKKETQTLMAHNTQLRSTSAALQTTMSQSQTASTLSDAPDMSLKIPSMSGQNIPGDLDIQTFQVTRDLHFFTHIEPVIKTSEKTPLVPLNEIHEWNLIVVNQEGKPVENANIDITGHMPGHVHGLPTQPRITEEIAPGVYRVKGVKFQMAGWWVMQFTIAGKTVEDTATFNLLL